MKIKRVWVCFNITIFLKSIPGYGTCHETALPANGGQGKALQEDNSEHFSEISALNCPDAFILIC